MAKHLATHPTDPRLKLFVAWQTLRFRREQAELFQQGQYVPLDVEGTNAAHAVAFAWRWKPSAEQAEKTAVVVVPRLLARWASHVAGDADAPPLPMGPAVWAETHLALGDLPHGPLKNVFTAQTLTPEGSRLALAAALSDFPVALLTS